MIAFLPSRHSSRLPNFRYAGPRLHRGGSTVLLGDAIHSVKPYFGLGVNSAFEDVAVLSEELDRQATAARALRRYSARRVAEVRMLRSPHLPYRHPFAWPILVRPPIDSTSTPMPLQRHPLANVPSRPS